MRNTLDKRIGDAIGGWLIVRLGQELTEQGHNLSGELIKSLEYQVRENAKGITISFLSSEYGEYVNRGVAADRVPFGGGRGGTSKYIQGLIRFVERRMNLKGKEATSVAFAIARSHKREGMPTRGSYQYSRNGRRTGWVDTILTDDEQKIKDFVSDWVFQSVQILLFEYVKKAA